MEFDILKARRDRSDFIFIDFRFVLDVFTVSWSGFIRRLQFLLQEIRILLFYLYIDIINKLNYWL
jgi:hypothetical protein